MYQLDSISVAWFLCLNSTKIQSTTIRRLYRRYALVMSLKNKVFNDLMVACGVTAIVVLTVIISYSELLKNTEQKR